MMDEKFWLAIAFLGFILLILKYVWPHLNKSLDLQSRKIAEEIIAAKEMRKRANLLLEQAKQYQKDSEDYAKKLLNDAKNEAEKIASDAQKALEVEIDKKTKASTKRIQVEEEMAIRQIKSDIIKVAVVNLEEDFSKNLDEKQQKDLIDKALEKLS